MSLTLASPNSDMFSMMNFSNMSNTFFDYSQLVGVHTPT